MIDIRGYELHTLDHGAIHLVCWYTLCTEDGKGHTIYSTVNGRVSLSDLVCRAVEHNDERPSTPDCWWVTE
jgi:hypothetical protein